MNPSLSVSNKSKVSLISCLSSPLSSGGGATRLLVATDPDNEDIDVVEARGGRAEEL